MIRKEFTRSAKHIHLLMDMRMGLDDAIYRVAEFTDEQLNDEYFRETKRDLISAMNNFMHCIEVI